MFAVEPVLITYNRAPFVVHTLGAFKKAGWLNGRFHVLDNASTDNTHEVIEAYQRERPELQYHRNCWNIGGNGNILRSVELGRSEYHWVIGDDDTWIFDGAEELDRVLKEGRADIIRLGWLVEKESRGRFVSARKLAETERLFFSSVSMISATIVRRSLVTRFLAESYQNISNTYPHLVPVLRGIEEGDLQVYTLSRDYMTHTPNTGLGYFFGDLEWYAAWYRTGRYLRDRKLRTRYLGEVAHIMTCERRGWWKEQLWLAKVALNAKGLKVPQGPYLMSMLGDSAGLRWPVMLAAFSYMLLPMTVAALLRRLYRRLAGRPPSDLRVDRTRL